MNILPWDYEGIVPYEKITIHIYRKVRNYGRGNNRIKYARIFIYDSENKLIFVQDSKYSYPDEVKSNIPVEIGELIYEDLRHCVWSMENPDKYFYDETSNEDHNIECQAKVHIKTV